jgi:cobalt-zinc-cadmium efflux system protein
MRHEHNHKTEVSGRKLLFTIILNFTITIAEVVGGIASNSLALISDAIHNFSDGIAVVIAYIANRISRKKANNAKTFGFKRAEIIAAFINALVLVGISFYLFYEAVLKIINPEPIKGSIMLIVATIGLLANFFAMAVLRKDSAKNINIRAAYLHLLGDTVSSVGVIAGAVIIIYFDFYLIDPIMTFLIGFYILKETYEILKESIDILMQGAPPDIEISKIIDEIKTIDTVANVHHIHLWNLNENEVHFEAHVELKENLTIEDTNPIRNSISDILVNKFGINHITIQFEINNCHNKDFVGGECF